MNTWKRDLGTGYLYTVATDGLPDERYFVVPGVPGNPAVLFAYGDCTPLARGTVAECQAACEPAGYREECDRFAVDGDPAREAYDSDFNAAHDDHRERYAEEKLVESNRLD